MTTFPIYSHRGIYTLSTKENTLPAFKKALKYYDGFECDLRLSKDRNAIVLHDHTLTRTHNIQDNIRPPVITKIILLLSENLSYFSHFQMTASIKRSTTLPGQES